MPTPFIAASTIFRHFLLFFSFHIFFASAQASSDDDDNGPLGTGAIPSPSQSTVIAQPDESEDGDNKSLYLIILVVLAVLLIAVGAYITVRRRKAGRRALHARSVQDVEAARMQHGLTNWRVTGGWHAAGSNIPLRSSEQANNTSHIRLFRFGGNRNRTRIEEGLDENGEAPPPYSAASTTKLKDAADEARSGPSSANIQEILPAPSVEPSPDQHNSAQREPDNQNDGQERR